MVYKRTRPESADAATSWVKGYRELPQRYSADAATSWVKGYKELPQRYSADAATSWVKGYRELPQRFYAQEVLDGPVPSRLVICTRPKRGRPPTITRERVKAAVRKIWKRSKKKPTLRNIALELNVTPQRLGQWFREVFQRKFDRDIWLRLLAATQERK